MANGILIHDDTFSLVDNDEIAIIDDRIYRFLVSRNNENVSWVDGGVNVKKVFTAYKNDTLITSALAIEIINRLNQEFTNITVIDVKNAIDDTTNALTMAISYYIISKRMFNVGVFNF